MKSRRIFVAALAALAVSRLAVPAMPRGSPGMEADVTDPYAVLLVQRDGRYTTYARYRR